MSTLFLGKHDSIRVKSCDSKDHCEVQIRDPSSVSFDYLTRDDAIKLIEFLQIEYRLGQYGEDDLHQQARADGLRANGITEEELAESAHAHREAAELARGQ